MRRLHSRILGWGGLCGQPPTHVSELFLKGLPPPLEADPQKFERFKREELFGVQSSEPFFDIVDVAAGSKHFAMVTSDGNAILMGSNRYGQVGQPTETQSDPRHETMPFYYDLEFSSAAQGGGGSIGNAVDAAEAAAPNAVVCGCNYTILYRRGGLHAYCVGNNHHGQLGLGHKNALDNKEGFAGWEPRRAEWLMKEQAACEAEAQQVQQQQQQQPQPRLDSSAGTAGAAAGVAGIRNIVCGFNHTMVHMISGRIYACGTNLWGELGIGSTTAPMAPTEMRYFDGRGMTVVQIAAGSSFTLFLTADGRVYGCGATNAGQLPPNVFEPAPVPLIRVEDGKAFQPNRMMRIKRLACLAEAAVYVTTKDEILLQGSLPELGLSLHHPRYRKIVGRTVTADDLSRNPAAGTVVDLHAGSSTLLVEYGDGALFGLGCNLEGQVTLHPTAGTAAAHTTSKPPAPSTSTFVQASFLKALQPVPISVNQSPAGAPTTTTPGQPSGWRHRQHRVAMSSSGALLLDHGLRYGDEAVIAQRRPIDLPPGRSDGLTAQQKRQATSPSSSQPAASRPPPSSPTPPRPRKIKF